jgi:DnaJ homolog subfamily B member 4
MKIKRSIIDGSSGRSMEVEEIVEIDMEPGWKDGTKVTFVGKGDELRGRQGQSQDVQFVIKEQPHNSFKREGNDLLYTARINLRDALVGGRFEILHLNGKQVPVSFQGPVNPATVQAMRCAWCTELVNDGA